MNEISKGREEGGLAGLREQVWESVRGPERKGTM